MKRYGWIALLTLSLAMTACGDELAPAPAPTPLFMGRYTPRTSVAAVLQLNEAVGAVQEPAEAQNFAAVEAGLVAGGAVTQWLSALDAQFAGDATGAGAATLQGAIRAGLARWRMAPTDMVIATGTAETVEKTLDVARVLSLHSEVRAALTAIDAGQWSEARTRWDRAAAWFTTLESAYTRRSDTTRPGIWGAGSTAITDENLATRTVELLARGAQLIDAQASANARDAALQLLVYSTKFPFLGAMNYAFVYETRVAEPAMGNLEYPRAEGGALFEGVVLPFHGRAPAGSAIATAVATARARWAYGVGAAQGPTRLAALRDCGALYAALTADGVAGYATATDAARAGTRSTLRGVVDTLDEALAFAQQDPAMMRAKIATAEARSAAGDHAGAATIVAEVQRSIDAVARAGQ